MYNPQYIATTMTVQQRGRTTFSTPQQILAIHMHAVCTSTCTSHYTHSGFCRSGATRVKLRMRGDSPRPTSPPPPTPPSPVPPPPSPPTDRSMSATVPARGFKSSGKILRLGGGVMGGARYSWEWEEGSVSESASLHVLLFSNIHFSLSSHHPHSHTLTLCSMAHLALLAQESSRGQLSVGYHSSPSVP